MNYREPRLSCYRSRVPRSHNNVLASRAATQLSMMCVNSLSPFLAFCLPTPQPPNPTTPHHPLTLPRSFSPRRVHAYVRTDAYVRRPFNEPVGFFFFFYLSTLPVSSFTRFCFSSFHPLPLCLSFVKLQPFDQLRPSTMIIFMESREYRPFALIK
jgi:hypothetical protein